MKDSLFETPYFLQNGRRRLLACKRPKVNFGGLQKMYIRQSPIPRDQWQPLNRRWMFLDADVLDQGEIGSCVANGSVGALRKSRFLEGQADLGLSPGCLYAQINGGSDNGAVISDALTALQQTGTCMYELVGEEPFYLSQLPNGWQQDALRFRICQAFHCQTFDEICSALQLGFVVVYGIRVGNNFQNFDAFGVAGATPGPGNHCMHADGMIQLPDGRWVLDNVNSWGSSWGPWGNGRCYLSQEHFQNGDVPDAFAIQSARNDPKDVNEPPTAVQ